MKKYIKDLRDKFKKYEIDGYVIPKNDDYFTEYSKLNRLEVISNFSGSAGLAIILKNKNYLFTDGRYTIQSKIESGKSFKIYGFEKLINCNLFKNLTLGIDPKLFTNTQIKNYFLKYNKIKYVEKNLIDEIKKQKRHASIPFFSLDKNIVGESISSKLNKITKYLKNNKPHILLGCPGRINDMLKRRRIDTNTLKLLVIDEADELLSNDFKSQIYNIFQFMPDNIQVALFSATLPNDLINITNKFMRNPIEILVKSEQLTLDGIKQYYIALDSDNDKYSTLKDLYNMLTINQCIIYCNSVSRVQELYEAMDNEKFPVCRIHSKMSKEERKKNYEDFKLGTQRVLISSNVTARGVDIQQVSVVINFDIPNDVYTYLHRIGRSGRWGRKGTGINFVTKRDLTKMKNIEQYYSTEIQEMPSNVNI